MCENMRERVSVVVATSSILPSCAATGYLLVTATGYMLVATGSILPTTLSRCQVRNICGWAFPIYIAKESV